MKKPTPVGLTRELRRNQTEAEGILWSRLRNQLFDGEKFRRQHPIGDYVVDFVCIKANLIVELDGGQHNESAVIQKDEQRTQYLESRGYQVIRIWDNEVFENLEGVQEKIYQSLTNRLHPHLNPLPPGRGEEKEG